MLRDVLANNAVQAVLVAATSLLLVGHGGDTPDYDECEGAPYQSITFAVRGTCGDEGQIVVVADGGSCQMKVGGAWDVGLPDYGNRQGVKDGDLLNGGWEISGAPGRGSELGYTCDVSELVGDGYSVLCVETQGRDDGCKATFTVVDISN